MTILCIDFMNLAHRARSGFQAGDYPVVFNFFRQFKALVEQFKPTRVYIALEGRPVERHQSMPEYKANRVITVDDPRRDELERFYKQKDVILGLLSKHFPVAVVRHPTSEADDTIANLVRSATPAVPWTIISSDTDFIQLLQEHPNVSLYNPVKKQFVVAPEYPYVTWKALRGDSTDNIPGIPGIGDKTAEKIAIDSDLLLETMSDPSKAELFQRNYDLIEFKRWSNDEAVQMTSSSPTKDWLSIKTAFDGMGFQSITKDGTWEKFVATFDRLW